jgi:hypothetical protein
MTRKQKNSWETQRSRTVIDTCACTVAICYSAVSARSILEDLSTEID